MQKREKDGEMDTHTHTHIQKDGERNGRKWGTVGEHL